MDVRQWKTALDLKSPQLGGFCYPSCYTSRMNYLISVIIISVIWGVADIMRKLSAGHGDSKVLTIMFNLGATLIPVIWLVLDRSKKLNTDLSALVLNIFGGGLVGIGGVLIYGLLEKNSASVTFGLVRTITLMTVVILSLIFLSDKITIKTGAGFLLSLVGVYLLASR